MSIVINVPSQMSLPGLGFAQSEPLTALFQPLKGEFTLPGLLAFFDQLEAHLTLSASWEWKTTSSRTFTADDGEQYHVLFASHGTPVLAGKAIGSGAFWEPYVNRDIAEMVAGYLKPTE